MAGALHTCDPATHLGRAWSDGLRAVAGRLIPGHSPLSHALSRPASTAQPASGDCGGILLVQLSGARCAALADALAGAGHDVQVVQGLPAALSSIQRWPPALVMVDGPAEPDVYRTLRQAGAFPILALIPQLTDAQMLAAFAVGVDDCQASQIHKAELMLRIRNMLRPMGGRAATAVPDANL